MKRAESGSFFFSSPGWKYWRGRPWYVTSINGPCCGSVSGSTSGSSHHSRASSAGVDLGAAYGITANYWLESDNLVFPAVNGGYYGVGVQGNIPKVCEFLASTNLNCMKFRPYFVASGGITRVTVGSAPSVDHGAAMACIGSDYDPTGSGKFTVGLFRFCPARLPGLQGGVAKLFSSSINLGWGSNAAAAELNEAKRQKMLLKERKRMEKLQLAAAKSN